MPISFIVVALVLERRQHYSFEITSLPENIIHLLIVFIILAFSFISLCTICTTRNGYDYLIYVTLNEVKVEVHMTPQPPYSTMFTCILLNY